MIKFKKKVFINEKSMFNYENDLILDKKKISNKSKFLK